jgi:hypothetical protein
MEYTNAQIEKFFSVIYNTRFQQDAIKMAKIAGITADMWNQDQLAHLMYWAVQFKNEFAKQGLNIYEVYN